jgi:hypothetical protein
MVSAYDSLPDLSERISLRILIPRLCIRTIATPRDARVGSLKPLLPNPDATLICNGVLLSDEHTIEFYRITSNDSLVAIPPSSVSETKNRWMAITEDSESFAHSVSLLMQKESHQEMSRLRDLALARRELRPTTYRIRAMPRTGSDDPGIASRAHTTIIPDPLLAPLEIPLPVCW